jgi:hypothetical protein
MLYQTEALESQGSNGTSDVWIVLHAIRGRMGNYMMQYSSALGLQQKIPRARLCLTPMTLKRRGTFHHLFQGPFATGCPRKLWIQGDWFEVNNAYQEGFVEQAMNCSSDWAFRMINFGPRIDIFHP